MVGHASELWGFLVVAREEGAQLGTLSGIHIEPASARIVAFSFRTRRVGGDRFVVPIDAVQLVGRDVIIVGSESDASRIDDVVTAPGRSLEQLQGIRVTTADGHHLGNLVDIDFVPGGWAISDLTLAEDKHLAVEAEQLHIGDEIIVPAEYSERVVETHNGKPGFMRRVFGSDRVDQTKAAIERVLHRDATDD